MTHDILPKRPYPFLDESLPSYICRLAQLNHYGYPLALFQVSGLTMPGYMDRIACTTMLDDVESLKKLSSLCEVSTEVLWSLTYGFSGVEGRRQVSNGILIPENTIHNRKSKVCPGCLREQPAYGRKLWELVFYTVCEKHSISMVDYCFSCGKMVDWKGRYNIYECRCGADYRKISAEDSPADSLTTLSTYIASLVKNELVPDCKGHVENPLFTLGLGDLFSVLTFMCGQVLKQYIDKDALWNPTQGIKASNEQLQKLLVHVMHIFTNWPLHYYEFLEHYHTKSKRHTGLKTSFGYFYEALYSRYTEECFNFLRHQFELYVAKNWTQGTLMHVQRMNIDHMYMPAAKAANLLGVSSNKVREMIQNGELEGVVKKRSNNNFILVTEESVKNRIKLKDEALTYDEVMKMFDVGRGAVRSILDHGCIRLYRGPQEDGFAKYLFDRDSVIFVLHQFDFHLDSSTLNSADKYNTFGQLVKGNSVGTMVKLVLDGVIKPCGTQVGQGLNKYLFRVEDKMAALLLRRDDTWLTTKDVAKRIGAVSNVAAFWIKGGFIEHEVENGRVKIKAEAVAEFQRSFITLGEILKITRRGSNSINKLLATYNIFSLTKPEGGHGYLYLRAVVEPVLPLISKQQKIVGRQEDV